MKPVAHVDAKDVVVGFGTVNEAIQQGLALRIARVFVVNDSGMVLLQRRAPTPHSPVMKWDQSAGGHVDAKETYREASRRELAEEMGIVGVTLRRIAKFYTQEPYGDTIRKRFNTLFIGTYSGPVRIDRREVADYQWILPGELGEWLRQTPSDFTQSFPLVFDHLRQYYKYK